LTFLKWHFPATFWTLIILILTWYPKIEIPDIGIDAEDKIAHIGVFCLWSLLMLRMFSKYEIKRIPGAVKLLIIAGTIFAIADESVQGFVPGRHFSFYDMLANNIGIWLSVPIFKFFVVPVAQRISHNQD